MDYKAMKKADASDVKSSILDNLIVGTHDFTDSKVNFWSKIVVFQGSLLCFFTWIEVGHQRNVHIVFHYRLILQKKSANNID